MEKVVKIFNSFEEQEADEVEYWKNLPGDRKAAEKKIWKISIGLINTRNKGRNEFWHSAVDNNLFEKTVT